MAQAPRDENRVPAMLFVGSDGLTYPAQGDEETGKLKVVGGTPSPQTIADTGTVINLGNVGGNLCNMASANATATYTLTGSVDFGSSLILINRATAPTITGATNILGSDFIANTDMYLQVFNNGTRVEYWLEQIAA